MAVELVLPDFRSHAERASSFYQKNQTALRANIREALDYSTWVLVTSQKSSTLVSVPGVMLVSRLTGNFYKGLRSAKG